MFLLKLQIETLKGRSHVETGRRIKESSDSEMAELWTRPKVSHRLFRACQCTMGNSVSDLLSGTTLYNTAVLLLKMYTLTATVQSAWGRFVTVLKSEAKRILCVDRHRSVCGST